jgi:outer membrane protein OmpA-like peptidoglycan-associated protein
MIFAAGALLVSSSAMAQAGPVAQVTSDQLVCQLSGDCATNDTEATQDKPDSRGFRIARTAPAQPAATAQPQPARVASPQGRFAIAHTPTTSPNPPRPTFHVQQVGRADLSIGFVSGSATLTDSGRQLANTFLQALRAPSLAGKRFQIGGHTDAVGSRATNLDLSQRRAQALVDYLVEQGANRTQFVAKGFGYDRPLRGTNPRAAANRRVEVVKLN